MSGLAVNAKLSVWGKILRGARSIQSVPGMALRLLVNAAFWSIAIGLLAAGAHFGVSLKFISYLTPPNSPPLDLAKLLEFADGSLWVLQLLAGGALLVSARLLRLSERHPVLSQAIHEELDGAVLNFGTLFVLSAVYTLFAGHWYFLFQLTAGFINIAWFSFRSHWHAEQAAEKKAGSIAARVEEEASA
jgi:hypothetical protein